MVLYLKSAAEVLGLHKLLQIHQTELPFFTFHKMCFAYLNNDWMMVISSLFTLLTTLTLFLATTPLHLLRSNP